MKEEEDGGNFTLKKKENIKSKSDFIQSLATLATIRQSVAVTELNSLLKI